MTEMIERVARALREDIVRQYLDNERIKSRHMREFYEDQISSGTSSTAIEAMREPSPAMYRAGYRDECDAAAVWRAMIDAALEGIQ